MNPNLNGTIIGYDPGGNNAHGCTALTIVSGKCSRITVTTLSDAEHVLRWINGFNDLIGIGVDTLACWSTGSSGWREADLWLKQTYADVQQSVVSPNGLYGSMGLNGMAVLVELRKRFTIITICETHPKVLYRALSGNKYDYQTSSDVMDAALSDWTELTISTKNDHEWDSAVSALAAYKGLSGHWAHDLFTIDQKSSESRLVFPCGSAHYWWPE